jgi:UDP-N-acetyl-D-glucosamine dehydrogenase
MLQVKEPTLLDKILAREAVVGICGLGYVGLPLALTFGEKGFPVIGFDIDKRKIDAIGKGQTYIKHIAAERIEKATRGLKPLTATMDFRRASQADALILCVPTPLNANREPDMTYIENTARAIGPYLRSGQLVVLESSTYPGTTEEVVKPILEELSGLRAGIDFFLAFSPEREDPGNPNFNTATIPKVVGGYTKQCTEVASALYASAINKVVPVKGTREAELTKLLENIFRCVNIALVNEIKMLCERMNIDIWEVIDAAATKPFGFMPFYPGPGLGGHCIPIDPFYLTWKAREFEFQTRFIELAGEINWQMPYHVVERTMDALNEQGVEGRARTDPRSRLQEEHRRSAREPEHPPHRAVPAEGRAGAVSRSLLPEDEGDAPPAEVHAGDGERAPRRGRESGGRRGHRHQPRLHRLREAGARREVGGRHAQRDPERDVRAGQDSIGLAAHSSQVGIF